MAKDDKKNATTFQLWFEEAWEGWIRPLGLMLLLAIGYVLYKFDIIGEHTAGLIAVLAIVVGAIVVGALPALPLARAPWQRAMLATMVAAALGGMVYPAVRAAVPGKPLAQGVLTPDKTSLTLTTGQAGPYELDVSGHFKETAHQEAEAGYTLKVTDNGGGSDEVSGTIERKLQTVRSRKGSSSFVEERNEKKHRLDHVRGPQVTISADASFDELEGGIVVALRHGGANPIVFWILGVLAIAMALVLDTRLIDFKGKTKSYLTAAIAIAFVFSIYYAKEATPARLVKTAISEFLFALVIGGLGGWLLGGVARALFGPKPPKKAAASSRR